MSLDEVLVRADQAQESGGPLRAGGDFAFDTETHAIQPGLLAPPVVLGSFAGPNQKAEIVIEPFERHTANGVWPTVEFYAGSLMSDNGMIIGANIAYDFACIAATVPSAFPVIWGWYEQRRVYDIQIAATLNAIAEGRLDDGQLMERNGRTAIDPKSGKQTNRYSLALCVKEWLGRTDAKENSKYVTQYGELERVPFDMWPWEAKQYPLDDAQNTYDVFEAQVRGGCANLVDLPAQAHTAFCLHLGAIWGIRTDAARIAPLKQSTAEHFDVLRKWALSEGMMRFEKEKYVKNTKVIKARVEAAYNNAAPKTDTGQTSADRVTLEESGDEVLEKFAEISKVEKVSGYLETLEGAATTPLNIRPNVLLATGRASYEGIVQLLPREGGVRGCIKFRGVGSSVDYAAVELSTLAQVCIWMVGHSDLADAINAGKDPHCILAARLANEQYETFYKRYKDGDVSAKDLRQAGKAANFGFPGMMGAPKFVIAKRKEGARVCEWFYRDGRCGETKQNTWKHRDIERNLCSRCLAVAEELRDGYLEMWSEIKPYWKIVATQVEQNGYIEQFISKRRRGIDRAPAAANSYFQGLASEGAKRAVVQLTKEMYIERSSPLFGSRLTVFAHDESIIDIPEMSTKHVSDAAHRQATVMIEGMKSVVPDVAIKAEPALMRYWYKKAEPVFNEEGLLVPWEPK